MRQNSPDTMEFLVCRPSTAEHGLLNISNIPMRLQGENYFLCKWMSIANNVLVMGGSRVCFLFLAGTSFICLESVLVLCELR